MKTISDLMLRYLATGTALRRAVVADDNPAIVGKGRELEADAVRLIVALCEYHGLTSEVLEAARAQVEEAGR